MPAKYRVAVIGSTGRGDYGHGLDTVWLTIPECVVVGVADADEKGRAAAAARLKAPQAFADYRELLDKTTPDLVAIAPRWVDQHREMCLAAAERGMHIYMEKPFCRSPREADEIIAACEGKNIKLALAHQTRYSPKLQVIRDLIADGKLGSVLELRGRGKEDARGGGEDLWVLGSHVFNLMHHFGGDPQWCFAQVTQAGRPITKQEVKPGKEGLGPLAGNGVSAMYGLDGGETAYFSSYQAMGGQPSRFGLQIYGSKGVLEILTGHLPEAYFLADPAWSPGRSKAKWQPISSAGVGQPEPLTDGGLGGGNQLAVRDLLSAIENDRLPECNMYEGRTTIEMITGVFASHIARAAVTLPLASRDNPLSVW